MRIFIGMETSGQVRRRLQARGHWVISCDLLPADDGADGHTIHEGGLGGHWQGNVFDVLAACDRNGWHFEAALFHPDCTYLTVSAAWAYKDPDYERYPEVGYHQRISPTTLVGQARRDARSAAINDWERIAALRIPRIIAENPAKGALSKAFRRPDQIIHPYMFGDDASKETGLWLWGDATGVLVPRKTQWVAPRIVNGLPRWGNQTDTGQNRLSPSADRWQERSKTYDGIADALAKALTQ